MPKYGQNIKYDVIVLQRQGITLRGVVCDTMIAGYLLNPSRRGHNMDALSREYLQYEPISYEDVAGKGAKQVTFDQVDVERATQYSAEDADVTLLLARELRPRLVTAQLDDLFADVEMPLIDVLVALERRGMALDSAYLRHMSLDLQGRMETLLRDIHDLGRRGIQRQLAAATAAHPVRSVEAAAGQENQDRLFDRRVGAGESGGGAQTAETAFWTYRHSRQDEVHLRGCPAATPERRNRATAHLTQPDDCRDRTPEQQQPQPAEHPDPLATGP